jgi:hypothetical protein
MTLNLKTLENYYIKNMRKLPYNTIFEKSENYYIYMEYNIQNYYITLYNNISEFAM